MKRISAVAAALLLGLSAAAFASPKHKAKKKRARKGAAYDYSKSKYKAKAADTGSHYRFDSRGRPIRSSPAKTPAGAKTIEAPKLNDQPAGGGQPVAQPPQQ